MITKLFELFNLLFGKPELWRLEDREVVEFYNRQRKARFYAVCVIAAIVTLFVTVPMVTNNHTEVAAEATVVGKINSTVVPTATATSTATPTRTPAPTATPQKTAWDFIKEIKPFEGWGKQTLIIETNYPTNTPQEVWIRVVGIWDDSDPKTIEAYRMECLLPGLEETEGVNVESHIIHVDIDNPAAADVLYKFAQYRIVPGSSSWYRIPDFCGAGAFLEVEQPKWVNVTHGNDQFTLTWSDPDRSHEKITIELHTDPKICQVRHDFTGTLVAYKNPSGQREYIGQLLDGSYVQVGRWHYENNEASAEVVYAAIVNGKLTWYEATNNGTGDGDEYTHFGSVQVFPFADGLHQTISTPENDWIWPAYVYGSNKLTPQHALIPISDK